MPTVEQIKETWGGLSIADLTNAQLLAIKAALIISYQRWVDIATDPRYIEKMKGQPPRAINPQFMNVQNAIQAEITKRGI